MRKAMLLLLALSACEPQRPKGPHYEQHCVANPLVGGRPQGGFIPVCDHYDSVWVAK